MLFPYTFMPHSMDKMQEFLDYIFEVWCSATTTVPYAFSLFDGKPELKALIETFNYSDTAGGDLFNRTLEEVYGIFQSLTPVQKTQLRTWYQANNQIEQLCANDPTIAPVDYDELKIHYPALADKFKAFYPELYDARIRGLKAVRDVIGEIDNHYNAFLDVNNQWKCPFCGISDLKGSHQLARDAYDHFLPKGTYPFNTINFKNLAPICHTCNSSYKLKKNPLYDDAGHRRRAFFPYSRTQPDIQINVDITKDDIESLTPSDVHLTIGSTRHAQEVETWKELFGIEKRYQEKCASLTDGKYWFAQIFEAAEGFDVTLKEAYEKKIKQTVNTPFADSNFLRKPFLEACHQKGLFND